MATTISTQRGQVKQTLFISFSFNSLHARTKLAASYWQPFPFLIISQLKHSSCLWRLSNIMLMEVHRSFKANCHGSGKHFLACWYLFTYRVALSDSTANSPTPCLVPISVVGGRLPTKQRGALDRQTSLLVEKNTTMMTLHTQELLL